MLIAVLNYNTVIQCYKYGVCIAVLDALFITMFSKSKLWDSVEMVTDVLLL